MNINISMEALRIRPNNSTIKQLNITQEQFTEIDRRSRVGMRRKAIKEVTGCSPCAMCADVPQLQMSYPAGDEELSMKRVEYYCEVCVRKVFEREKEEPKSQEELAEYYGIVLGDIHSRIN